MSARAADLQNVYRARGYTRAAVKPAAAVLPPAAPAGRRPPRRGRPSRSTRDRACVVRSVTFDGHTVLTEAELRALTTPTAGRRLLARGRRQQPRPHRARVPQPRLRDVDVDWAIVARRTTTREADVRYTIVEGPQSIVDHIIIVGNERTSTETITASCCSARASRSATRRWSTAARGSAALGLFRRVDIQPLQHTGESRRDVLVQVEEADPTTIGIGGGAEAAFRTRLGEDGLAEERFESRRAGSSRSAGATSGARTAR